MRCEEERKICMYDAVIGLNYRSADSKAFNDGVLNCNK